MNRRGRRFRRAALATLTIGAVVLGTSATSPAQESGLPVVDVVDAIGPSSLGYKDCEGATKTVEYLDGGVLLERSGDLAASLTVAITYSGSLADDLVEAPTEATFSSGSDQTPVFFAIDQLEDGDLVVTVEGGVDYEVGTTPSATVGASATPEIAADCGADLSIPAGSVDRQVIKVGQTPAPLGFEVRIRSEIDTAVAPDDTTTTSTTSTTSTTEAEVPLDGEGDAGGRLLRRATDPVDETAGADRAGQAIVIVDEDGGEVDPDLVGLFSTPVVGTLPPGLTYVDDVWTGTATTAGTYPFQVRLCIDYASIGDDPDGEDAFVLTAVVLAEALGTDVCLGRAAAEIVVVADTVTPAATPVNTAARFTG